MRRLMICPGLSAHTSRAARGGNMGGFDQGIFDQVCAIAHSRLHLADLRRTGHRNRACGQRCRSDRQRPSVDAPLGRRAADERRWRCRR